MFSSVATPQELDDLARAIANNCECRPDGSGNVIRCASHTLVLGETVAAQQTLQRLLHVRRDLLPLLCEEEFRE